VVDTSTRLADTLRKCVVLGGQAGSVALRDWATHELRGYRGEAELPAYRRPGAVIKVDAVTGNAFAGGYRITGQQISPSALPDPIAEVVDEEVPLIVGVGEIEAMVGQARANGGFINMTLPDAPMIVRLMNQQIGIGSQQITAIYWVLGESALLGVLDQLRTILAELVAEMRAGMPDADTIPSGEVADQAVHVAVHGDGARVNVTTAQSSGGEHHVLLAPTPHDQSLWKKIGGGAVGLATIAGVIIAILQWQNWGF